MQTNTEMENPGSNVTPISPDWCQVKETITLLCVASAQISTTIKDSTVDIEQLTTSFTEMARDSNTIKSACKRLEEENKHHFNQDIETLTHSSNSLLERVSQAVYFFQFHDRLNQKLGHITQSLSDLGELIGDEEKVMDPISWKAVQDEIRASYTMECERLMFDFILRGASIKEALELYHHNFDSDSTSNEESNSEDDIELF